MSQQEQQQQPPGTSNANLSVSLFPCNSRNSREEKMQLCQAEELPQLCLHADRAATQQFSSPTGPQPSQRIGHLLPLHPRLGMKTFTSHPPPKKIKHQKKVSPKHHQRATSVWQTSSFQGVLLPPYNPCTLLTAGGGGNHSCVRAPTSTAHTHLSKAPTAHSLACPCLIPAPRSLVGGRGLNAMTSYTRIYILYTYSTLYPDSYVAGRSWRAGGEHLDNMAKWVCSAPGKRHPALHCKKLGRGVGGGEAGERGEREREGLQGLSAVPFLTAAILRSQTSKGWGGDRAWISESLPLCAKTGWGALAAFPPSQCTGCKPAVCVSH